MKYFSLLLTIQIVLFSCNNPTKVKEVNRGFYYWKSTVRFSPNEYSILQKNKIMELYVKFFDVDWSFIEKKPIPKAIVRFQENRLDSLHIIPVIFITNRTLQHIEYREIENLSESIHQKIKSLAPGAFHEIQIDCDWTLSTKVKYFHLLKKLSEKHSYLSATIRLHQIKYFSKTGVPPVKKGMLMCYNMADWQKSSVQNSIFDLKILANYIENLDAYPLPLDVVFPVFRWTIIYRNDKFLGFVNNLDEEELAHCTCLKPLPDSNKFEVVKDTFAFGKSIRKGDIFRTEYCSIDDLLKGSHLLSKKISNEKLTFALYHLDDQSLSFYHHESIQKLFQSF